MPVKMCVGKRTPLFPPYYWHGDRKNVLYLKNQKFIITLLLNDIYRSAQSGIVICTFRSHFFNLNQSVKRSNENCNIVYLSYSLKAAIPKLFMLQPNNIKSRQVATKLL